MDKYDTSQLTEFPRFESEPSPSGVSTFFNKLRKLPLFTPSEGIQNPQISPDDEKKQVEDDNRAGRRESEDVKTETGVYAVELEVRTLPNVLRRISSLIALGSRVKMLLLKTLYITKNSCIYSRLKVIIISC